MLPPLIISDKFINDNMLLCLFIEYISFAIAIYVSILMYKRVNK